VAAAPAGSGSVPSCCFLQGLLLRPLVPQPTLPRGWSWTQS
jgi:hypothetical protein